MYKLSIIIPVYNTEKRIGKCLDSLICQSNDKIEIIVINDGSTDNSEDIIQGYRKRFPNHITYYTKQNTGIADTRNFGIEKAQGKYICFVDSDDYMEFDLIQLLEKYMDEDIDIIKFKLKRVDEQGQELEKVDGPIFHKVDGQQAFNLLAFKDVLLDSPCVYFFKKELFTTNHLKFKIGTEHEDFGLIPLVILTAKTMVSVPNYGYYYVQTSDSITRNKIEEKTQKKMQDVFIHYDEMLAFIQREEITKQTQKNIKIYYTNAILLKLKELKPKQRKPYKKEIKQRNMIANIQVHNIRQFFKKILLKLNMNWYLKLK